MCAVAGFLPDEAFELARAIEPFDVVTLEVAFFALATREPAGFAVDLCDALFLLFALT